LILRLIENPFLGNLSLRLAQEFLPGGGTFVTQDEVADEGGIAKKQYLARQGLLAVAAVATTAAGAGERAELDA